MPVGTRRQSTAPGVAAAVVAADDAAAAVATRAAPGKKKKTTKTSTKAAAKAAKKKKAEEKAARKKKAEADKDKAAKKKTAKEAAAEDSAKDNSKNDRAPRTKLPPKQSRWTISEKAVAFAGLFAAPDVSNAEENKEEEATSDGTLAGAIKTMQDWKEEDIAVMVGGVCKGTSATKIADAIASQNSKRKNDEGGDAVEPFWCLVNVGGKFEIAHSLLKTDGTPKQVFLCNQYVLFPRQARRRRRVRFCAHRP